MPFALSGAPCHACATFFRYWDRCFVQNLDTRINYMVVITTKASLDLTKTYSERNVIFKFGGFMPRRKPVQVHEIHAKLMSGTV